MSNEKVKYIVAVLTSRTELLEEALQLLSEFFGPADYQGAWHDFNFTDYYKDEMGTGLRRIFISFERLGLPEEIYKTKEWCAKVEQKMMVDGKRPINLDPGYIDNNKVVLASGKFGCHKIPVTKDCWADLLLYYSKGKWLALPWTFPDFRSGIYDTDLLAIRRKYKNAESVASAAKR